MGHRPGLLCQAYLGVGMGADASAWVHCPLPRRSRWGPSRWRSSRGRQMPAALQEMLTPARQLVWGGIIWCERRFFGASPRVRVSGGCMRRGSTLPRAPCPPLRVALAARERASGARLQMPIASVISSRSGGPSRRVCRECL